MRISIDFERCQGHGRCFDVAPDLVEDDGEGYGSVIGDGEVRPDHADAARSAVRQCPEQAVTLG
ncbi:MAG: ferredoxin [Streptosporangiaceae bacterium]|nr:ferredoxin [Streptosporangiaceae bacterium]